jgi:ABC-type transport system substrate-binding protein
MQKVKWLFFGYIAFVALVILGIAVAVNLSPARDPDTYYLAYSGAIKTLDPAEGADEVVSGIFTYFLEGLYNYRYNVDPYQLFPELAAAMPTVSPDGLTMTIPVRHGIHYYDPEKTLWPDGKGPEVTAADFVYSFKRVCDSHTVGGNYSFVFQDRFVGVNDWYDYTQKQAQANLRVDYDNPVAGFTVDPNDKYKLVLRFTHPYPQIVYNLVNNPCAPVCRQLVEYWGDAFRQHPVGTGPYAMAEHLRDQRITMIANPIYRGRPDIDGNTVIPAADRLPKIKRIQLEYFAEDLPVWFLFKEGLFDIGGIPKDAFSSAVGLTGDLTPEMKASGIELRKYAEPTTEFVGFNMSDPVVGKNKPLRQAMSMAFDRDAYIQKFLNGRGMPAIGPIPPGFPTFDEHRVNPYTRFDLAKARVLLKQAEQINGGPIPPLKILFRGAETLERQMAAYYTEEMAQIGLTLQPEFVDFARYLSMVDNRQYQIADGGWQSDYPDEQDFYQLFYGPNAPDGGLNSVNYQNPEFDRLYNLATSMQNTPQRTALYNQMSAIVEEDCCWLMTDYPKKFELHYDWLKNRRYMDYGHGFAEFLELDKDLRAKRLSGQH